MNVYTCVCTISSFNNYFSKNLKMNVSSTLQCKVCGDKAAGYKYSGLCCESCKVFFQRYASQEKKLNCIRTGNCEIDISTRKNCRKCRLFKCFANGMFRQTENRQHVENSQTGNLDLYIQNSLLKIENSLNYPNPIDLNLPSTLHLSWGKKKYISDLFTSERELIANVTNKMCDNFVEECNLPVAGLVSSLTTSVNLSAHYIRRIVRFCKNIPAFKQLTQQDQLTVLKPFFFEILSIRFAYNWNFDKGRYPVIENESASQVILVDLDCVKHYDDQASIEKGIQFQNSLYSEMEGDFTIRDLLTVLLLFKPRANISNLEFVQYQHSLYCRLLLRYLEHKYKNVQNARNKYRSLIRLVESFDNRREGAMNLINSAQAEFGQLAQIIIELFNVNICD